MHLHSRFVIGFWNPCLLHSRSGACYLQHSVFVTGSIFSNIILIVQFMMSANTRIRFGLQIVLVCLYSSPSHYHHCAKLSEGIELIKCLSDILSSVWVRLRIISPLSIIQCGAVCFQFTHFSCDDWENIHNLSYYHHQIGSMSYHPLFRVRSWNNGVRFMSFYILMNLWYGRIASWDIRVLVVFAPNLALCHWHAVLLTC